MADEPTLFSAATADAIDGIKVYSTERTVTDFWVELGDRRFDAADVYETLTEVRDGDVVMTDPRMVAALKAIHVIEWEGSQRACMGARTGPNFEKFMERLKKLLAKAGAEI